MSFNFKNERYQRYYDVLMGKHEMEMLLPILDQKSSNSNYEYKYSKVFVEDDKFCIINITKLTMGKRYSWQDHLDILDTSLYSLYLHKERDFVVLKTNIFNYIYGNPSSNFNIKRYYKHRLNQMGYEKVDFKDNIKPLDFKNGEPLGKIEIKVLIPNEKTEDDIAALMGFIEQLNSYIENNPRIAWEDTKSMLKHVNL